TRDLNLGSQYHGEILRRGLCLKNDGHRCKPRRMLWHLPKVPQSRGWSHNVAMTRRTALAIGAGAATRLFAINPKHPRLFFNWDGSLIHCWGRTLFPNSSSPLSRDQFVSIVFTPLENAGVDALLFSFGSGNVAEYQSNVLEWPGQADKFRFPSSKT